MHLEKPPIHYFWNAKGHLDPSKAQNNFHPKNEIKTAQMSLKRPQQRFNIHHVTRTHIEETDESVMGIEPMIFRKLISCFYY